MGARIKGWLGARWAPVVIIAVGLALAAPALTAGFAGDDHLHRLLSRDDPGIDGLRTRRLDLFVFVSGDRAKTHRLMDAGMLPWWTDPDAKLAFMRPLSSLTHAVDLALWPDSPTVMLAHNLVWFGLALVMVWLLFRRFIRARWIAGLALLLYAVDDAHGPPVGWIANRNAMIALALAIPVLLVHDRWRRDGWRPGRWLGPALLIPALLAGESSLAIGAYLVAHAIHLDRGTWRARAAALAPYLAVVVVWRAFYQALGYGVHGSGIYIDPGAEPLAFLAAAAARLPLLLLGQFALPWSDLASLYPLMGDGIYDAVVIGAVVAIVLLAVVLAPLVRDDPTSRFFATGMLLAAVPVCSTFPADRLLWFVGIGGMGLVASLFAAASFDRARLGRTRIRRGGAIAAAVILALVHLVLAPPFLALRSRSMVTVGGMLDLANDTIPRRPDIREKTVILVNAPADPFAAYVQIIRHSRGEPAPARLRWLATGMSAVNLERVDARTLRVTPEGGFLRYDLDRMVRNRQRPFEVGERIRLTGLTIEITSLTKDGRPGSILARFETELGDPQLEWLRWDEVGFVPYTPPAVGRSERLPRVDFARILDGSSP